jgi:hypothetical protein
MSNVTVVNEFETLSRNSFEGTEKNNEHLRLKKSSCNRLWSHRFVRCLGSHIFYTIGSQMAVRLSALHAGPSLPPGRFLVLIYVRG